MATIHIPSWPFPEDEVVTIHWIGSPTVDWEGKRTCQVFFRTASGEITPVAIVWGYLSEIWIGQEFVNGVPREEKPTKETSPCFCTADVKNIRYGKAVDLIPKSVYALNRKDIFHEWCCSFEYGKHTYIIPCVELARVLFARNSLFANQLLSTGGLEDLIDLSTWRVEKGELQFDFSSIVTGLTPDFANHFVSIYGNRVLREGWDHTYTQFAATGKIKTKFPQLAGLRLRYSEEELKHRNIRFIKTAELVGIPMPYSRIEYGPEKLRHTGKSADSKGVMKRRDEGDDILIDLSGTAAKRAGATTLEKSAGVSLFDGVKTRRKTKTDDTSSSVKVMKVGAAKDNYSPGDILGRGELPFLNIEHTYMEKLDSDPDFEQFCGALNVLIKREDVRLLDLVYDQIPPGKRVSTLALHGNRSRRYACAVVQKGTTMWLILELCVKDGYSISTLFVRNNGNTKECINQVIDALMRDNGSWGQINFADKTNYRKLVHWKERSVYRWAELMYEKML